MGTMANEGGLGWLTRGIAGATGKPKTEAVQEKTSLGLPRSPPKPAASRLAKHFFTGNN